MNHRKIEWIFFIVAYGLVVGLSFVLVLPRVVEFVFLMSIGVAILCSIFTFACSIVVPPLRDSVLTVRVVFCMILTVLGALIARPSEAPTVVYILWTAISSFTVMGWRNGLRAVPYYVIAVVSAIIVSFSDVRWIGFLLFSMNSLLQAFLLRDTSSRFIAFYVASFSIAVSLYVAPYFESSYLGLFLPIVAYCFGIVYPQAKRFLEAKEENETLAKKELELIAIEERVLKAEIRPHFFLNVLNNVQVAYHVDKKEGRKLLNELIDLERRIARASASASIPLSEEMAIIDGLVRLYSIEHNSQVRLVTEIEDENLPIPPMLLEPLVENALIHSGILQKEGGMIHIVSRSDFGLWKITVSDNGIGADPTRFSQGIGVSNVFRRVGLLNEGRAEVSSSSNGTTIYITFRN